MQIMKIEDLSFDVTVLLGKVTLPLKSYLGLQVGDILVLEQSTEKGLVARVGSTERYFASAGLFETHKAIVIDGDILPGRD
jgi:flagellar motor switch protein FliM